MLKEKMYSYLTGDFCVDKMTKSLKKCKIKHKRTLDDYKSCLEKYETVFGTMQRSRSDIHSVFTEKVNKNALSVNDDKRIQTFVEVI